MLSAIHSEMKQNVDVLTLTQHILWHVEKGVKIDVHAQLPIAHQLKGSVSQDFRPLVFFMIQTHLGP